MRCPSCGRSFRTLDDEQHPGEHPCPYCLHEEPAEPDPDADRDWLRDTEAMDAA